MPKQNSKRKLASYKGLVYLVLAVTTVILVLIFFGSKIGLVRGVVNLIFSILLIFAFLGNVGLFIALLSKNKQREQIPLPRANSRSTNENDLSKARASQEVNNLKNKYIQSGNETKSLRSKISKLIDENIRLKEQLEKSQEEISSANLEAVKKIVKADTEKPILIEDQASIAKNYSLFFDGPYNDRLFSVEGASSEKQFRYVYRIEIEKNEPTRGELHLDPDSEEYDILRSYSDTVLKPACLFQNSYFSGFTKIEQVEPGKVQKQGGDWFVKEKVKIKFV